ncbi:MAG: molybdopterin-dependent oxidoreductase [Nisaea sp.]|uniref:molybdopterin-dependent oxidoreductase n=1 Tax=Nisaea sp. TaxID=2024842 RepID=UPI001B218F70|nr:molybdopterin-dependent oxidoreductase [Nisaea sp.]MBO6561537.1 molybdopterin-dependent oxidoreductase [Nisaea sp.]
MSLRTCLRACAFFLLLAVIGGSPAWTGPARAAGEPLLTVSGNLAGGSAVDFDRETLESMATETIRTSTPWTQGVQEFRGIPLKTLLAHVGAKGVKLRAIALNDYAAEIPVAEATAAGALVAVRQNGKPMSVRDKGPLWIVFPYDSDPKLVTDDFLNWSAWQLRTLVVQ